MYRSVMSSSLEEVMISKDPLSEHERRAMYLPSTSVVFTDGSSFSLNALLWMSKTNLDSFPALWVKQMDFKLRKNKRKKQDSVDIGTVPVSNNHAVYSARGEEAV